MADADAEKKEKLAAAKKRVEQLKKKTKKAVTKKGDAAEPSPAVEEDKTEPEPEVATEPAPAVVEETSTGSDEKAAVSKDPEDTISELSVGASHQRTPSISQQSRMRSSSFRQSAGGLPGGLPSPGYGFPTDGDTAPEIHRKQALKIEELEKENKRLAKEASDGEKRWKKAEGELEDLRDADTPVALKSNSSLGDSSAEIEKLKAEIAALERQNTQLSAQSLRRQGTSPSLSPAQPDREALLISKNSTIESMEIEISNLRAQLDRVSSGSSVEKEQIAALEDKLARSERSAATAQRELGDLKKNLDRTTEKAVKEGSERTSAETKLRTLERESETSKVHNEELQQKVDALEKKAATLATLHKEHDARFQAQKREREKAEKEAAELKAKLGGVENENLRLKEERDRLKKHNAQGVDDEGVDELENEERLRLEAKVRELEAEVHELRRGIWRERRQELDGDDTFGLSSPKFTDVDLGGTPGRRRSIAQGKGIGDFFTSGFNAITGAHATADTGLLDDDDDMDFDEDAFRLAQEEEAKKRVERVKETKRALKNWEGWRLDLVEQRRGGGGDGVGEIFEV